MDIVIGGTSSVQNYPSEEYGPRPTNKKGRFKDRRKSRRDRRKCVREGIFVSLSVKNDRRVLRDRRRAWWTGFLFNFGYKFLRIFGALPALPRPFRRRITPISRRVDGLPRRDRPGVMESPLQRAFLCIFDRTTSSTPSTPSMAS